MGEVHHVIIKHLYKHGNNANIVSVSALPTCKVKWILYILRDFFVLAKFQSMVKKLTINFNSAG